jgi:hypothetical protein
MLPEEQTIPIPFDFVSGANGVISKGQLTVFEVFLEILDTDTFKASDRMHK